MSSLMKIGGTPQLVLLPITITPAIVATVTTAEQIFACPGVVVGDTIVVSPPGHVAGVAMCSARVSSNSNIGIVWANPTAAGVTPPAGSYLVAAIR